MAHNSSHGDACAPSDGDKFSIKPLSLEEPVYEDRIRFVCISDTHGRHSCFKYPLPSGDVLLHAGDFSQVGRVKEIESFNSFLAHVQHQESLPYPHKVVIAGNHELSFDPTVTNNRYAIGARKRLEEMNVKSPSDLLTSCCYLENTSTTIAGYKIFGSPNSVEFYDWAFMYSLGEEARNLWKKIPADTDIVLVHGPALGFGDRVFHGDRVGCPELLEAVQKRVKPRYLVCGHIHEDNGIWSDGVTTFINAALCDLHYKANNRPYIFDLPLPEGMTKAELHALKLEVS